MPLIRHSDPYVSFRLRGSTSAEEHCGCRRLTTAYLAHVLTENPIHCASCQAAVTPERIGFDPSTAELVTRWNIVYGAVYELWLDCGRYEVWAESELLLPTSHINESGLRARARLSRYLPCRYLWFWQGTRPGQCPVCRSSLRETEGTHLLCTTCAVYV